MAIKFYTDEYERSHWRKPKGRGLWIMRCHSFFGAGESHDEISHNGTLAEAKAVVRRTFKNLGIRDVEVQVMP